MRLGPRAIAASTAAAPRSMLARPNPRDLAIRLLTSAEMAAALESESETSTVPRTVPKHMPARMMKRIADMSGRTVMKSSSAEYAG